MNDSGPLIRHARLAHGNHVLETSTHIRLPVREVFSFFSDVENLQRITPPELVFQIMTSTPLKIVEGTVIDYRLCLFGVPFRWRARIPVWDPPLRFVDEQIKGPYHTWIHLHAFEMEDGGTRMTDRVQYRLPGHPLAGVLLPLVRRQLNRIFEYRARTIQRILARSPDSRGV